MGKTGIINYGSGNFTSVWNALEHLGLDICQVDEPESMQNVSRLILPGVGAFPAAMERLQELRLIDALHEQVCVKQKPFLGICVGMQLLADLGHEFRECPGLGYIPGEVCRIPDHTQRLRIPHMGWNDLTVHGDCPLFAGMEENPSFYFVHSFRFEPQQPEVLAATCEYGEDFCAAIQRDHIFGVQFHPEKSQRDGLTLLENFCSLN